MALFQAHDFHDVAMVSYIICNIPWMFGGWACSTNPSGRNRRYDLRALKYNWDAYLSISSYRKWITSACVNFVLTITSYDPN